jgi:hypothetical protein
MISSPTVCRLLRDAGCGLHSWNLTDNYNHGFQEQSTSGAASAYFPFQNLACLNLTLVMHQLGRALKELLFALQHGEQCKNLKTLPRSRGTVPVLRLLIINLHPICTTWPTNQLNCPRLLRNGPYPNQRKPQRPK